MHARRTSMILAALLLTGALLAGIGGGPSPAHAQGSTATSLLAVVEGREAVFVRSGPSIFYPVAGYLTAGSLIAVDGRSARGTDAWVRTWLNHREVWVPGWRLTVLGDAYALPIYFRLPTPPYPVTLQTEAMRGDGVLRLRRQALGDLVVRMRPGDRRLSVVAAGGIYRLEVYFVNQGWAVQEIEIRVDGQVVSSVMVQKGVPPGLFGVVGYDSEPFLLRRGLHRIELRVTGGDPRGIEIDEIALKPVPQRFESTRPVG